MTKRITGLVGGVSAVLLAGACESEEAFGVADDVAMRELVDNGMRLNGMRLNGMRLNGMRLNGMRLNGDDGSADYVEIKKTNVADAGKVLASHLIDSELFIATKKDGTFSGLGLVDTIFQLDLQGDGRGHHKKDLKITGFRLLAPGSDVAVYNLEVKDGGSWQPLCEDGSEAILLADVWNPETGDRLDAVPDTLTFACRGAALAKCVEFGYHPWASASGVSLRDYHQACTRMLRADYCGDGVTHTTNGTPIHVLDELGVQTLDAGVNYVVEAEWGPDGATCLNGSNTRHADQFIECDIPACGSSFASGGLIQSGKVL
jgi:hypothetical protein